MEKPTYEQLEHDRDEWKELYFCELHRGDREMEEVYSAPELDRARQSMAGWTKRREKSGSLVMEFDS